MKPSANSNIRFTNVQDNGEENLNCWSIWIQPGNPMATMIHEKETHQTGCIKLVTSNLTIFHELNEEKMMHLLTFQRVTLW